MTKKAAAKRRGPIRTRNSEYSAEKLMRSALKLFSKEDFNSVTIKDIAAETGVNTALIYYYYRDKEDLFRAAVEFAIHEALERYSDLVSKQSDPRTIIDEWFQNNLSMVTVIRQLMKIMLDYASSGRRIPSVDASMKKFYAMEEEQILQRSIARGVADGTFRECDSKELARFVSIHLDGIMVASIIRQGLDVGAALVGLRKVLFSYLLPLADAPPVEWKIPKNSRPAGASKRTN